MRSSSAVSAPAAAHDLGPTVIVLQVPVHQRHRECALSYCRGHPLHRLRPDIACDEQPGQARLQEVRLAVQVPARGRAPSDDQVAAR